MGELLFEILFEVVLEGAIELAVYIYTKISLAFFPDRTTSPKVKEKLKKVFTVIFAFCGLSILFGGVMMIGDEPPFSTVGKFMVFVPLSILAIQMLLSIVFAIKKAIRKRR